MKPFHWSLQRVHELREGAERNALLNFSNCLASVEQAELRLDQARAQQADLESALSSHVSSGVLDPARIARWHAELEEADKKVQRARLDLTAARRQAESAQELVSQRRGERRATETLREQAQDAHRLENNRLEQREFDEVAIARHTRNGVAP